VTFPCQVTSAVAIGETGGIGKLQPAIAVLDAVAAGEVLRRSSPRVLGTGAIARAMALAKGVMVLPVWVMVILHTQEQ
jgi:hypothetical protein